MFAIRASFHPLFECVDGPLFLSVLYVTLALANGLPESTLCRCWLSPNRPTSGQKFRSRSSTCVYTRAVRFFHEEVLVCECC